jgi:hypothetical protein
MLKKALDDGNWALRLKVCQSLDFLICFKASFVIENGSIWVNESMQAKVLYPKLYVVPKA